jgi:L-alanine-DL-glutamate epimerase-like enolase superfamily enzyme
MKLAKLETLRLAEFPNLLWLRLHTDQGLMGLGETSFSAESIEAYLHEFVAPRDCTGPLVYAASVHFSIHAPNALVQESVRAVYTGWYRELVTHVPQPVRGFFEKPPGAGTGLRAAARALEAARRARAG